jgi:peroxiredoxin
VYNESRSPEREAKMEMLLKIRPRLWAGLILAAGLATPLGHLYGQVVRLEPAQPRWGQTLTVTYDAKATGAKFSPADEVYVVIWESYPGHHRTARAKLQKDGNTFRYQLPISEPLAFFTFHFVTPSDWDAKASTGTMVYRPDGVPARGASQEMMLQADSGYKAWFQKEVSLYPDNYTAYRDKWFLADYFDRDSLPAIVEEDIGKISREAKSRTAEYLYALSYGYLKLKQEEKSRECLKEMMDRFPDSQLTMDALASYAYYVYAEHLSGPGPEEISRAELKLIESHPDTETARDFLGPVHMVEPKDVPLATLETICHRWTEEEPENPRPYYQLGMAYDRNQKLDAASSLLNQSINLMLSGKGRLYGDIQGQLATLLLPDAFLTTAKIALNRRDAAAALSAEKAAEALARETLPEAYEVEGETWQMLSNPSRAESAYLQAWQKGSKKAAESLKTLYAARHGTTAGFDEYLKTQGDVFAALTEKKAAPEFHVKALDGQQLDSKGLRGNVLVINFWFTGCGPCRAEIPQLNKLVAEFRDKNVVFIAFANDDTKALESFLKEVSFTYHLVPDAGEIAKMFGVVAYPEHVVVDKEGRIFAILSGAGERRYEDLKLLIERAG